MQPPLLFLDLQAMIGADVLLIDSGVPVTIPTSGGVADPTLGRAPLDFAGYNTLSAQLRTDELTGGNDLAVTLCTVNPATGALVGSIGNVALFAVSADGSYGATLYLPAMYVGLTIALLPFGRHVITFDYGRGSAGTVNVIAFNLWLTCA